MGVVIICTLWSQIASVWVLTPPSTSWVALGKLLGFSVLQFPHP